MQLLLTDYNRAEPIRAIKAVRTVSGLGLREAKHAIDSVRDNGSAVIEIDSVTDSVLDTLAAYNITFTAMDSRVGVLRALRAMPRHLTIGEVLAVLDAME